MKIEYLPPPSQVDYASLTLTQQELNDICYAIRVAFDYYTPLGNSLNLLRPRVERAEALRKKIRERGE